MSLYDADYLWDDDDEEGWAPAMMPAPQPPSSAVPKSLTDNDATNLEKIAQLRAYAGGLRAAIRSAYDELDVVPDAPNERLVRQHVLIAQEVLSRALEIPAPENPTHE